MFRQYGKEPNRIYRPTRVIHFFFCENSSKEHMGNKSTEKPTHTSFRAKIATRHRKRRFLNGLLCCVSLCWTCSRSRYTNKILDHVCLSFAFVWTRITCTIVFSNMPRTHEHTHLLRILFNPNIMRLRKFGCPHLSELFNLAILFLHVHTEDWTRAQSLCMLVHAHIHTSPPSSFALLYLETSNE